MEQPLTLRWQSASRYYTAMLTPDLFGGWMLVTSSNSRQERSGRVNQKPMANYEQGLDAIRQLRHRRRQEGYNLCDGGFAEMSGFDPRAQDVRAAETNALLRVFDVWGLSKAQQAALLGIDARALEQYLDGRPLADEPGLLLRVRHLLAIHKAMRLRFGQDRQIIQDWLRLPCDRLEGRCPLDLMLGSSDGLSVLRQRLEQEADKQRDCRNKRGSPLSDARASH